MKCFNVFLSGKRVTVERMFGIFLRKWGIFWRPLEHSMKTNTLIFTVCAKLHKVCINHWMSKGKRAEEIQEIEKQFTRRDASVFLGWGESSMYDSAGQTLTDQQYQQYSNFLPNDP